MLFASFPVVALLAVPASVIARGQDEVAPTSRTRRVLAAGAVAILIFFVAGTAIRAPVEGRAGQLVTGQRDASFQVSGSDGRSFRLASPEVAHDTQVMVTAAQRLARRGSTLFVGPQDLRTAGANDVFLYYLLPDLDTASYFMQVDPHTTNRPGSHFVRELQRADFLILTSRFSSGAPGPRELGPAAPNDIVARRFCVRAASGSYRLYQRCR